MKHKLINGFVFSVMLINSAMAQAIQINFDYRYDMDGFFTEEVKSSLSQAANFYENIIGDQLTAISTQSSSDSWRVGFRDPSDLSLGFQYHDNLEIEENTLTVFVGAMDMYGSLGYAQSGYVSANGSEEYVDNVFSRGQGVTQGESADDYSTWGGAISFASDVDWYFGATTDGLNNTNHDFLTTATHELGHLFGYGSADSWANLMDDDGLFSGEYSLAAYGSLVPTDGAAHWAEGVLSLYEGELQETMMDPSTPAGERQLLSELDVAGLKDIGWQIQPVPLPPAFVLFLSGFIGLFAFKKRVR